ncbi:MAG: hypothetical protein AAB540_04315 [Patescibacteria group bacterium]
MGSPENFSKNIKLMDEGEVREILAGGKDPVDICRAAIHVLSQMETNFGEALSVVSPDFSQSPYEGTVDMGEKEAYTEFEKTTLELKDMADCLLFDMATDLSFCGVAADDFGEPMHNFALAVDEVSSLLMSAQSLEKKKIEDQLAEGSITPELKHKEFLKKVVEDEMVRIEERYGLEDLFVWNNFNGNYSELAENLKRFDAALRVLSVGHVKLLSEHKPRIVLGNDDGLALTSTNQLVVSLKWDTPQRYPEVLKEAIMQYGYFQKAQEKMREFVKSEGVGVFTWDNNIYDGIKLYDSVLIFLEAYGNLTSGEKDLFKKYKPRVVLGHQCGIVLNTVHDEIISVDYMSPKSFLEDLKNGIHQYRCFKEVEQTLSDIGKTYGHRSVYLWTNVVYDYEDVQKNLIAFRRALEQLSENDLEIIRRRGVAINLGNGPSSTGLVNTKAGNLVIELYYKDDYEKMVSVIKESIRKFEMTAIVSTQSSEPKIDKFLEDPLLGGLDTFELPLEARALCNGDLEEFKIAILRNLNLKNKDHSDESIVEEARRLAEAQERYSDVALFKNRNVLLAFNNEKFRDKKRTEKMEEDYTEQNYAYYEKIAGGRYRFGTKIFRQSVDNVAGSYEAIRAKGDTVEHLKESKRRILDAIRTTPPPFTFVFSGHGEGDHLELMNWEKMKEKFGEEKAREIVGGGDCYLTGREIADAISDRYVNFPQLKDASPEEKDIFIINACDSNNLLISVYKFLSEKDSSSMPIMISSAEYGQYGFSEYSDYYGSRFFSKVLGLSFLGRNGAVESTIKTILENQSKGSSNPTVFIPIEDSVYKYMQIADKDVDSGNPSTKSG